MRPPTARETCEMIQVMRAAKTIALIPEVTAGLTCTRRHSVAFTQPLRSAATMMSGTNARKSRARVESPRKARNGQPLIPAAVVIATPQRKNPHAVENATGMIRPP